MSKIFQLNFTSDFLVVNFDLDNLITKLLETNLPSQDTIKIRNGSLRMPVLQWNLLNIKPNYTFMPIFLHVYIQNKNVIPHLYTVKGNSNIEETDQAEQGDYWFSSSFDQYKLVQQSNPAVFLLNQVGGNLRLNFCVEGKQTNLDNGETTYVTIKPIENQNFNGKWDASSITAQLELTLNF